MPRWACVPLNAPAFAGRTSVRRVFPSTATRPACQTGPSRQTRELTSTPDIRSQLHLFVPTLRTRRPRRLVSSESHLPRRCARRWASDIRRSTPGVLGSGASCAVSRHPRLRRPHPSVSQARDDFAAVPFIRRAFAVRERLGDPRDLPYFRCCPVHTCHRPYAGGFEMLSRYCTHRDTRLPRFRSESPPTRARLCQQYPTGVLFRRCIVRFMLRPACLPRPPDWLDTDGITCVPSMLLRTLSPPLLAPVVTVRRWESG